MKHHPLVSATNDAHTWSRCVRGNTLLLLPVLEAECSHLADKFRSVADHLIANAMERLDIDLFWLLDLNEPQLSDE